MICSCSVFIHSGAFASRSASGMKWTGWRRRGASMASGSAWSGSVKATDPPIYYIRLTRPMIVGSSPAALRCLAVSLATFSPWRPSRVEPRTTRMLGCGNNGSYDRRMTFISIVDVENTKEPRVVALIPKRDSLEWTAVVRRGSKTKSAINFNFFLFFSCLPPTIDQGN